MAFPFNDALKDMMDRFRSARCDYNAAKKGRFRRSRAGVSGTGRNADYHYYKEYDYLYAMETARDIDRNDLVVGQGVDRFVDNVVADGYTLDPQTGNDELDAYLKKRWKDWSEDPRQCDQSQEHDFREIERLVCRTHIVDGDCWPILMRDGSIDVIEAHRVRTPSNAEKNTRERAIHGVEMGPRRVRKRLWVTRDDIHPLRPLVKVSDIEKIPFNDPQTGERVVLQVYRARRKTQTRGFTAFAPIIDATGMHDDIQFATLVQKQIVSCFAILRNLSPDADLPSSEVTATGETTTETAIRGGTRTLQDIGPGMDLESRPGETLSGFSPNIPNPEFFPHAMMVLTFIAINLGLPVAVLLLDPSQTNFSGYRGAMDQAQRGFRRHQNNLRTRFHRPVYRWKIGHWLATDPVLQAAANKDGVDVFGHIWHPPAWDYIEPHKDAAADLLQTRNSMTSRRRICTRRGLGDWEDLAKEIVADNAILAVKSFETAQELNAKHEGINIGWRELAYTPTPDGVRIALPLGEDATEPNPAAGNPNGGTSDGKD